MRSLPSYIIRCCVALLFLVLCASAFSQTLAIYHLDVGQGDATLIVAKDSAGTTTKSVLIDGGLKRYGQGIIDYATDSLNLTKLDYVIASHYDHDHVAGLAVVLKNALDSASNLTVDSVFDRGETLYNYPGKGAAYKRQARRFGNRRKTLTPGQVITLINDTTGTGAYSIKMRCICVNGEVFVNDSTTYNAVQPPRPDENDLSTGFLINYAKFRYLTCGDIGGKNGNQPGTCDGSYGCNFADLETNVIAYAQQVSAYKVNHHGSRCSNNQAWITQASAPVAIISSGRQGRYKHPREEVVQELNADTNLVRFYMTAPVNYYNRTIAPKGVLNPAAGQPVVLKVRRVNNGIPITTQSVFSVGNTFHSKQ